MFRFMPTGTMLLIALLPAALPAQVPHRTKTVHTDQVDLSVETFGGEAEAKRLALTRPQAVAQAGLVNHFRMIFYSPEKRDAYIAHMGDLGFAPAVAEAVQKANPDLDLTPKLAGFHFPTLIITGRFDMNVAPLTAWRMAHEIPGARIVFFEKSGHLPAYEEPDKYVKVLEAFLDAA